MIQATVHGFHVLHVFSLTSVSIYSLPLNGGGVGWGFYFLACLLFDFSIKPSNFSLSRRGFSPVAIPISPSMASSFISVLLFILIFIFPSDGRKDRFVDP